MAFLNRIRLPFYLSRPQFPDESKVLKLAGGRKKLVSTVISKVYEGKTDYLPEWVHEKLIIALSHDIVNIEDYRLMFGVVKEGEYGIEWSDFKDYPYAQADFKVAVTPFSAANSNCQSCEEATQLNLVDDTFSENIEQGQTYSMNVFENDTILCSPVTAEISYFNPFFVESAEIDAATGILTIVTAGLFLNRNTVHLVSYRVTCPSGSYDEASVYGNTANAVEAVLSPKNITLVSVDYNAATYAWDPPAVPPTEGYEWKVVETETPGIIVASGTEAGLTVDIANLDPATDYTFSMRSVEGVDNYSEWANFAFSTIVLGETCGRYKVEVFGAPGAKRHVTYIACNNNYKTAQIFPFKPRNLCLLQHLPGQPVDIIGADQITYIEPC